MPLLVAISVLSACVIGYEILLMRLFSIIQWHNFAYMIISLALLGYGAAGTFIALFRERLLARFRAVFAAAAAAFGIAATAAFALAQLLPFNPLELVWDIRQQLYHEPEHACLRHLRGDLQIPQALRAPPCATHVAREPEHLLAHVGQHHQRQSGVVHLS